MRRLEKFQTRLGRLGRPALLLALTLLLAIPALAADSRAVRSRVAPAYPELAKRLKIGGQVTVHVTVDAAGNVTDVKATNGNRMLTAAAEDAVHRWKFAAGDGTASLDVVVDFVMPN